MLGFKAGLLSELVTTASSRTGTAGREGKIYERNRPLPGCNGERPVCVSVGYVSFGGHKAWPEGFISL